MMRAVRRAFDNAVLNVPRVDRRRVGAVLRDNGA